MNRARRTIPRVSQRSAFARSIAVHDGLLCARRGTAMRAVVELARAYSRDVGLPPVPCLHLPRACCYRPTCAHRRALATWLYRNAAALALLESCADPIDVVLAECRGFVDWDTRAGRDSWQARTGQSAHPPAAALRRLLRALET